jgi:phage terminase large subunit-like protein
MMKNSEIVNIKVVGYDKWNATQWAIKSTELGLPLEEYSQTTGNFNKPTKEMERLILSGNAIIDNSEITRFCYRNVVLKSDYNDNVKPTKSSKNKKIDGVISSIQSLGMYLQVPHYSNEIITI